MQNKKQSSIVKDALALCIITFVAALLLGFVNEITKEPRARAEAEAKAEAYKAVYADAVLVDDSQDDLNERVLSSKEFFNANGFNTIELNEVCVGKDANGTAIGYVMTITTNEEIGRAHV